MSDNKLQHQAENSESLSGRALLLQDIGIKLSQAREARRESINKPVHILKIPINHLQALEHGNWDALPDDVYVVGFLRQYSKYLNIDLSDEIERLKNSDYTLTRPLTFPDPPVAPSRRWAWLMGGAFVLLFVLFNVMNFNGDVDDNTAPDAVLVNPSTAPSLESAAISASLVVGEVVKPAAVEKPPKPSSVQVDSPKQVNAPKPFHAKQFLSKQTDQPQQKTTAAKAVVHAFRFEAVTDPVWLQIFLPNKAGNAKGRLLKEMLLKKGRYSTIRYATESLWITCGNALALRIRVDKKTVIDTGALSSGGKKILRDYHFDISHL